VGSQDLLASSLLRSLASSTPQPAISTFSLMPSSPSFSVSTLLRELQYLWAASRTDSGTQCFTDSTT